MESQVPEDKSSYDFFALSSINFNRNDNVLSSPSPTVVQNDIKSTEAVVERISQQRPEELCSLWHEIGFTLSISMSQIITEYLVSGFAIILPRLIQGNVVSESLSNWPASMFSLAVASTTLIFGRLADIYSGRLIYICGFIWLSIWSLIIGFARNEILLIVFRACQGIGASAILPSSLMLIGRIYRPGTRKNMILSIYGACAPVGFFIGILVAGISEGLATWGYYFWVGTVLTVFTSVLSYFTIPECKKPTLNRIRRKTETEEQNLVLNHKEFRHHEGNLAVDWIGGGLLFLCLNLLTVALIASTQAPSGWKTPYVYICFVLSIFSFVAIIGAERWIAKYPLVPSSFFCRPPMPALLLSLFLFYGSLSVFMIYTSQYMEQSMGASTLQIVAWYTPMAVGGCVISVFGGYVLHLLSGTMLLIVAGSAWTIAPLLFAIAPNDANYWAYVFPAMICATIGIDITFNVCNIYITSSTPYDQQGFAGAVTAFLLHFGGTICLAIADIVKQKTQSSLGERKSCQAVFWLEVSCAAIATIILVTFVRIGEAKSDFTIEEKLEQNRKPHTGTNMQISTLHDN